MPGPVELVTGMAIFGLAAVLVVFALVIALLVLVILGRISEEFLRLFGVL